MRIIVILKENRFYVATGEREYENPYRLSFNLLNGGQVDVPPENCLAVERYPANLRDVYHRRLRELHNIQKASELEE